MHDIGIQCCFDPICYKTVETQTDQLENAFNVVSEKTSNKPLLPGQDGAQVSVKAEESKIKHDHSYAMQPPPYVIFPTYEDDSFNAISPPPLYEVEVVLRTTTEDDESVVGNENGDDSDDEDDDDDDARDNEDLDPHCYLVKKNLLMTTLYCLKMKMMGTVHLALATAKRNTCYLTHVSISC